MWQSVCLSVCLGLFHFLSFSCFFFPFFDLSLFFLSLFVFQCLLLLFMTLCLSISLSSLYVSLSSNVSLSVFFNVILYFLSISFCLFRCLNDSSILSLSLSLSISSFFLLLPIHVSVLSVDLFTSCHKLTSPVS